MVRDQHEQERVTFFFCGTTSHFRPWPPLHPAIRPDICSFRPAGIASGFLTFILVFFRGGAVSPSSNPQHEGPRLRIYSPRRQGGPAILLGDLGITISRTHLRGPLRGGGWYWFYEICDFLVFTFPTKIIQDFPEGFYECKKEITGWQLSWMLHCYTCWIKQNWLYKCIIHPSIQWRYSPNRALASSMEVP
jgi:hypothetical protein